MTVVDVAKPQLAFAFAGYVTALAVSVLVAGAAAAVVGEPDALAVTLAGQVGFWAVLVATVLSAGAGTGVRARDRLDLQVRWLDLPVGVMVGVATQLVLVPALYVPFRGLIDEDDLSGPARDLFDRVGGGGLVVMAVAVVVVAPVVEELFFRGLLLQAMERRWGAVTAVAGSSVVFAATHVQPLQFPALALAGAVFAAVAVRSGRLGPAVSVHAAFNATTFAALALLR